MKHDLYCYSPSAFLYLLADSLSKLHLFLLDDRNVRLETTITSAANLQHEREMYDVTVFEVERCIKTKSKTLHA